MRKPHPNKVLADNLRRMRKARGYSQEELERRSGISRNYISAIERGLRNVTLRTLKTLADALGMHAYELIRPWKKSD